MATNFGGKNGTKMKVKFGGKMKVKFCTKIAAK